ncbi:hypothetical protein LRR81_10090 [Metabacillus sp. GX 13764]|uniref:PglD-related sugar-binding protein n=1 Tax=Metabacillus kandeliae TaxID=2900151 RepID=UPI001E357267|nr:hypothetical protein [Metabacillus kandeliae]MCD7034590.1 hypothetical protein [Metabacillus kandeliae]
MKELIKTRYNLLVLGAGGHGRVVKGTAEATGCFNEIDFFDDKSELAIGYCTDYQKFKNDYTHAFVAFGNNLERKTWLNFLLSAGYQIPTIVHPKGKVRSFVQKQLCI